MPAAQNVHAVADEAAEYWPAAQFVQAVAEAIEYIPAGHWDAAESPAEAQ